MAFLRPIALTTLAVACACAIACVSEPPAAEPVIDASADVAPTPDASVADTGAKADAATVDASSPDASDGAVEAEASIPPPTCIQQANVIGAFNHACAANTSAPFKTLTLPIGANFYNDRVQGLPYCPSAYVIGSASTFQENGQTYFRYSLTRKTNTSDPGVTTYGTFWLQTDKNGDVTATEMCDLPNKGKVRNVKVNVSTGPNGLQVAFTWMDISFVVTGQETWTKAQ